MFFSHPLRVILIGAALLPAALWARDTPSNMEPEATPALVADPLRAPRESIAAGQWRAALSQLQALQPQMARNADLHNLLGYVYRKQASPDLDKAFEHYRMALDIDPGHRGAHEYIGEAYLMRRQPAQAREHLETLERLCGGPACEEYRDLAKALRAYQGQ